MELCGGTHVNNTGEINNIKIVKQSSVAAGIRRIEVLTGNDLSNYIKDKKQNQLVREKEEVNKKTKQQLEEKKKNISLEDPSKNIIEEGNENSIKYYFRTIFDFPPNELPQFLDKLKIQIQTDVIVLFGVYEDKISIVVGVTQEHLEKISAIDIIKSLTKILGGSGGGGRPDFARAGGGNDKSKIPKACEAIKELIKSL